MNSAQKMNQNGIQSYNFISAVDFILFRKYIAAVQIINQWMNESKKSLFPGMIKNDS